MRSLGSPDHLAYVRRLAVMDFLQGSTPEEIASILQVQERSVWRWIARFRHRGWPGLEAAAISGRPTRLNQAQQRQVLSWIDQSPGDFGFVGQRWTAKRLAKLITEHWNIHLHLHSLNRWLRQEAITPQLPQRQARQKDPKAIAAWLSQQWPRIKKTPGNRRQP